MKILLTGKDGQVGCALHKKLMPLGEVIATNRRELDLTDLNQINEFVNAIKPNIIVNAAAYTKVDRAQFEKKLAYQVNTIAPEVLSKKAKEFNIPFIHFSTAYVFDGFNDKSYKEIDETNPKSIYGKTKYWGEQAIKEYDKHIILRTNWVFGNHKKNFLKTILNLIQEKETLNIVHDQEGAPTSSSLLANIAFIFIKKISYQLNFNDFGTYHVTSNGQTNLYKYAKFITDEAIRLGLKTKMTSLDIHPILSNKYSKIMIRPPNSKLNIEKIEKNLMLKLPGWEEEVKKTLKEIICKKNLL